MPKPTNKIIIKSINDGFAIQLAFGVYSAAVQTHHLQALQTDKSQMIMLITKGNG